MKPSERIGQEMDIQTELMSKGVPQAFALARITYFMATILDELDSRLTTLEQKESGKEPKQ